MRTEKASLKEAAIAVGAFHDHSSFELRKEQGTVRMAIFFFDFFDGENLWRLIRETDVIGAIGPLVFISLLG